MVDLKDFFLFWCGPFLKSLLNLSQYRFCFMFWFLSHEACGIPAPRPGMEPTPPALEGEVLTTGPPGKALKWLILNSNQGVWLQSPRQTLYIADLEQHRFELRGSTYTQIFFNSKYYSTTKSTVIWIQGWEMSDMEETWEWRAAFKLYTVFQLCRRWVL